jgi:hypothetical protein
LCFPHSHLFETHATKIHTQKAERRITGHVIFEDLAGEDKLHVGGGPEVQHRVHLLLDLLDLRGERVKGGGGGGSSSKRER